MNNTNIAWTDKTWNFVTGCNKISPGCKHCYANTLHTMRHKAYLDGKKLPKQYATPFTHVVLHHDRLLQPMKMKKAKRIFVNSMSDLFHDDVPDAFLDKAFGIMGVANQHTYQILTKRPERMHDYIHSRTVMSWLNAALETLPDTPISITKLQYLELGILPNVHLGISTENQEMYDQRITYLTKTPAAKRFLSCEPLLSEVHFGNMGGIDQVILGGESGKYARECKEEWVRNMAREATAKGVAVFIKQMGSNWTYKGVKQSGKHNVVSIFPTDLKMQTLI